MAGLPFNLIVNLNRFSGVRIQDKQRMWENAKLRTLILANFVTSYQKLRTNMIRVDAIHSK